MNLTIPTTKDHYTLELYNPDTIFNRIAGVYAFLIIPAVIPTKEESHRHAELVEAHTHHPSSILWQYSLLYIGITNNFYTRLKQHHKISQAITLGMTHIGILKIASGRKRKNIERELLKTHNPPLNQTWLYD